VALQALILRDLVVLRKHFGEFVVRTLVQPFLAVLRVFPPRLEQTARACGMASEGLS
jgi:ABC-2 type transport system permease protein